MALNFSDAETEENTTNIESPRISSSTKRGRSDEDEKWNPEIKEAEESKKSKKMPFHWNSTDECTILENFYEFAGKNGSYSKEFYHFVKGKLSGEVSNSQLSDKVYRLRKRFMKVLEKCNNNNDESNGKMRKFSDDHKVFELSSKIWGRSDNNHQKAKNGGGATRPLSSQWKPEEVERFYDKWFKIFLQNIKIDITCIPTQVLEEIRREWQEMRNASNDYELKNAKLHVEFSDIRCTQNNK